VLHYHFNWKMLSAMAGKRPIHHRRSDAVGLTSLGKVALRVGGDPCDCLRRMLKIANEDGKFESVPQVRFLKEPPARRGFLEQEKFEELVGLLPTHLRPRSSRSCTTVA